MPVVEQHPALQARRDTFEAKIALDALQAPVMSASFTSAAPPRIATISPVLQSVAEGYAQPGWRLMITDKDGWRLARTGSVSISSGEEGAASASGWMRLIYGLVLEPGAEDVASFLPRYLERGFVLWLGVSWKRGVNPSQAVIVNLRSEDGQLLSSETLLVEVHHRPGEAARNRRRAIRQARMASGS